jgi:tetratricopeptide (TPR) repeat protein
VPDPLTHSEIAALEEASRFVVSGAVQSAAGKLATAIRAGSRHPDILLVYANACERLGLPAEALGALQLAIQQDADRPDLWAEFGRLLVDAGRATDAVPALERAVALDATVASHSYNLGVACISAGQPERAAEALATVVGSEPRNAAAWAALGAAQQQSGELEESDRSLRRALEIDPTLLSAAHNRAVTLRLLDRPAEAVEVIEVAIRRGLQAPQSQLLRAHLIADTGNLEEAANRYRAIVATDPAALEAHELLARLLPQIGQGHLALGAYEDALRRQPGLALYRSAMQAAWDLKEAAALERWAEEALRQFGGAQDVRMMLGMAHGLAGDTARALSIIEPLTAAGFTPALPPAAYLRLKSGDLPAAERHALAATEADFTDQAAWSYLTVIWRLRGDERERWLADYDRFVMRVHLQHPDEFGSREDWMAALADELTGLHHTLEHPGDQSLRQGTQTRGNLFDKRTPRVRQLADSVRRAIDGAVAGLPNDPAHPFLSRSTGSTRFLGSWSVRLRSGGFHVSHIHQQGWLSSALYVALPPEVGGPSDRDLPPGALAFGIPEAGLGLDLPPRRIEIPRPGELLLFPSYFWHGTIPFESQEYRLTVAFDAVPG